MHDSIPTPTPALPRGTNIERYVVLSTLGRGGMGTVYAAYDPQLERRIAIKILHAHLVSEETRGRFMREAQALARLSHPNVVAVHDVGTYGDSVFIAMEYVAGDTFARWVKAAPRTCSEILAVLSQAGRGLAAAHAAGVVHRDVKPDNVLIAEDGRVVVSDFGLARHELTTDRRSSEPLALPPGSIAARIALSPDPVTLEGGVIGTIGYMSPEQACDETVDARSDQWSFCATLYWALYDRPPIAERTIDAYLVAVDRASVDPPPRKGVPTRVRRALERGLARQPGDRFTSMVELLHELGVARASRRQAAIATVALAALAAVVASVAATRTSRGGAVACPDPAPEIHEVWNADRRDDLRRVFESTRAPDARATADRVAGVLDVYAERWIANDRQACEATRVRHAASEGAMHVRLACLERRRTELASLMQVLSHADAQVVGRAVEAAFGLPSPASCDAVDDRTAIDALPEDPADRARVVEARRALADAESLIAAGKGREGLARAEEALAIARATHHRATEAEALMQIGDSNEAAGLYEAATGPYARAIAAGEAASDDGTVARAAARLAFISGDKLLRPEEAAQWLDLAYAALDRLGPSDAVRVKILQAHAPLLTAAGHPEEALPLFEELLPLAARVYDEESPRTSFALNNLGFTQQMLGRHAAALETHRKAVGILERTIGPDSPTLAIDMCNVGSSLLGLGRYDEARAALGRAMELASSADPESFWIGWASQYLGLVALRTGDGPRALDAASRGLAVAARRGPPAARLLVGLRTVQGRALLQRGDVDGAVTACEQGVSALEERTLPTPDRVLEWDPYACLGEAQLAKGKTDDAVAWLARSTALPRRVYPGDLAVARFGMARALLASRRDPARAAGLADEAAKELAATEGRARERDEVQRWMARPRGARP
jgi:tetratricopeptide (TPR) repeat protein/predicted Ser/Thr protein kinase